MNVNCESLALSKTIYFKVHINGRMELVPMEINANGQLKYLGRYLGHTSEEVNVD
ncbi:MAG: hypothetical protein MJA27_16450 [Pseudanabaenales cyanobacterium]|nr:hypothetical protein [Pseudanabaenales cyanobacterium]